MRSAADCGGWFAQKWWSFITSSIVLLSFQFVDVLPAGSG